MEINLAKANISHKNVILRLDLDVPLSPDGVVAELTRLEASLPSLRYCLEHAAKTLIIGHLGRPEGVDPKLSVKPALNELKRLIGQDILLFDSLEASGDWLKSDAKLGMLENLRFWPGEVANDPEFTQSLAKFGDFFVNDAFATSHRPSASIVGLPSLLPSVIGFQMFSEVDGLQRAFHGPKRPVVMLLGGVKDDKLEFVDNFLEYVDNLLIGGRLVDHSPERPKILKAELTPDKFDITAQSVELFKEKIATAGTVVWNGPIGKFESPEYAAGTKALAEAISASPAFTIVGGGDTLSAISQYGLSGKFGFVSLGGGAMLYFLAHHTLPGLEAIH